MKKIIYPLATLLVLGTGMKAQKIKDYVTKFQNKYNIEIKGNPNLLNEKEMSLLEKELTRGDSLHPYLNNVNSLYVFSNKQFSEDYLPEEDSCGTKIGAYITCPNSIPINGDKLYKEDLRKEVARQWAINSGLHGEFLKLSLNSEGENPYFINRQEKLFSKQDPKLLREAYDYMKNCESLNLNDLMEKGFANFDALYSFPDDFASIITSIESKNSDFYREFLNISPGSPLLKKIDLLHKNGYISEEFFNFKEVVVGNIGSEEFLKTYPNSDYSLLVKSLMETDLSLKEKVTWFIKN